MLFIVDCTKFVNMTNGISEDVSNSWNCHINIQYFYFDSTGVWTQGLTLVGTCSTTWTMSSAQYPIIFLKNSFCCKLETMPLLFKWFQVWCQIASIFIKYTISIWDINCDGKSKLLCVYCFKYFIKAFCRWQTSLWISNIFSYLPNEFLYCDTGTLPNQFLQALLQLSAYLQAL
jgi:hypothetical protein